MFSFTPGMKISTPQFAQFNNLVTSANWNICSHRYGVEKRTKCSIVYILPSAVVRLRILA